MRQIALGHGANHPGDFHRRLRQIADEGVDKFNPSGPASAPARKGSPLGDFSLLADGRADSFQFPRGSIQELNHIIECLGGFSGCPLKRHADAKIASLDRSKSVHKFSVKNPVA